MKTISRVLPFYNLTKTIKLPNGEPKHAHVRVLEVAFFDAYKVSKLAEETLKMQRPKHIRFKNELLLSVNNELIITDNVDLRLCRECQKFKKLDELSIENLHCSKNA